jgi:mono/diheme cytochrome c family protein
VNGYAGGGDPNLVPPGNGAGALFTGGTVTFAPVPRSGIVAALDVTTNKIVWRFRWADQCYSGLLATGGSLLFVGRADGRLTALDSTTGTQLWEFQTGAGMHAPVSTFERNGKQYVIAYSAGSALIGSPRGDSVWLFALDGTLPPATAGRPVSRLEGAANPVPDGVAAVAAAAPAMADLARGKELYEQACVVCHGADGKGGHGVGAPLTAVTDLASAVRTVSEGRNTMPPFRMSFSPDQIRDVSAYVTSALSARPR